MQISVSGGILLIDYSLERLYVVYVVRNGYIVVFVRYSGGVMISQIRAKKVFFFVYGGTVCG